MNGVVIWSSDLCSVLSRMSHAQGSHRESRVMHVASMTWDSQLAGSVENGWEQSAKAGLSLEEHKVISLGSAGFHPSNVPTF